MPVSHEFPEWIMVSAEAKRKLRRIADQLGTDIDDVVNRMLDYAEDGIACGGNTPSDLSSAESSHTRGATGQAWRPTDGE